VNDKIRDLRAAPRRRERERIPRRRVETVWKSAPFMLY